MTETLRTQGIKYAGSKLRLLPFILEMAGRTGARDVFDAFAGTTRVGQAFARRGFRVVSNDSAVWSRTFGLCYLKNRRPRNYFGEIFAHLNSLPPTDGWFTANYGGDPSRPNGAKRPWQIRNTRKLDAIRPEIDRLGLDETDRSVVLTSLILALDAVDSTIGHQAAYLKNWSARSFKEMELRVPELIANHGEHEVLCEDVFDALPKVRTDLAYLDPPYGSNNEKMPPSRVRYGAYYHIWTSVVLNDRPELFGKANRRADTRDGLSASVFEDFRRSASGEFTAVEAIKRLIDGIDARHVLLSYSSGGRATAEQLHDILGGAGKIVASAGIDYRRNVMSAMRWTNAWTKDPDAPNTEFLFLIEK